MMKKIHGKKPSIRKERKRIKKKKKDGEEDFINQHPPRNTFMIPSKSHNLRKREDIKDFVKILAIFC